jgi:hypothetical protein
MSDGIGGAGEITGEVCVANIGARGERRRRRNGIVWFALGLAGGGALAVLHAGPALQLTLFAPFALAALSWFEAREHT